MYLIACDDPALPRLFNPELPNSPALWAVLLGNYAGTALVDQFPSPTECVLRTNAALTYIGVHTSQSFLNQALIHLRAKGPVWLVWPHRTELLPPDLKTAEIVPRLEFSKRRLT